MSTSSHVVDFAGTHYVFFSNSPVVDGKEMAMIAPRQRNQHFFVRRITTCAPGAWPTAYPADRSTTSRVVVRVNKFDGFCRNLTDSV
jgi:hypothetical protein